MRASPDCPDGVQSRAYAILSSILRVAMLMTVCLIAVGVACSSSETSAPQQVESREAPASTSVLSARAQAAMPSPTTSPAEATAALPTVAARATSTSVPATPAPTSTSMPAPTAAPETAATSDASAPVTAASEAEERDLKIVTLLPFDAIPAILEPEFTTAEDADAQLEPHNLVLGLSINGDHRAYSIPTLSSHEIVNDTVGGQPVAVTW